MQRFVEFIYRSPCMSKYAFLLLICKAKIFITKSHSPSFQTHACAVILDAALCWSNGPRHRRQVVNPRLHKNLQKLKNAAQDLSSLIAVNLNSIFVYLTDISNSIFQREHFNNNPTWISGNDMKRIQYMHAFFWWGWGRCWQNAIWWSNLLTFGALHYFTCGMCFENFTDGHKW